MAKQDKEAEISLWERFDLDRVTPVRNSLSTGKIAKTAIALADAEGLGAVTMRRLATAMDVAPMAAYRYVKNKDELLQLIGDRVYAELEPPASGPWRESVHALAVLTRELVLRHPWIADLPPVAVIAPSPSRSALFEYGLSCFAGLPLDADEKMAAVRAMNSYVRGAVSHEIALAEFMTGEGWTHGDDLRTALAPSMTYVVETGSYPHTRDWAYKAKRKDDRTWEFEYGLDALLDGIAARHGI
ncbi:TetR/AcrR family transcriptional regulator [Phytomonospora sp. NPDC050363]|uniref:TetR/AcrR family transcriptional regulator n=1 Tax=Phytomonospora sp. NPDC050363 TaxID=3155642 RepID=UPI0033D138D8